jgi:hypothetical protein
MHAGLGECWVGMYVVMFGMACIEGAGLCIVCGSVIYIVVVLDGLVGIHDMDTPGKEAGGTGRGICIIVMWNGTDIKVKLLPTCSCTFIVFQKLYPVARKAK